MIRHILLFLGLVYSLPCFAQSTEYRLVNKYLQRDGLSSYNIRSIVQDPLGFIWIATQEGLNCFDGKNFIKYTYNNTTDNKILASDVRCLTVDTSRHVIWVLTNVGGLNAIDYFTGKTTKSISAEHIDNDDWNISMVLCRDKLWIGCMTSLKVYDIKRGRWIRGPVIPFSKNSNDDLLSVKTVHLDNKGNIWAFLNHYGIVKINAAESRVTDKISLKSLFPDNRPSDLSFTAVADLDDQRLIIGTSAGIKLITAGDGRIRVSDPQGPLAHFGRIGAIAKAHNHIYIADNSHLYKVDQGLKTITVISEANGTLNENWFSNIQNIFVDDMGNDWLGCKQGLAFLSGKKAAFKSVSNKIFTHSGLTHVYSVFPRSNHQIIIGQENGLLSYDSIRNQFKIIDKSQAFYYAFTDFRNNTIVTGEKGMFILRKGKLMPVTHLYPELKPVAGCCLNSHLNIGDSVCVMGSDNNRGIFLWNFKKRSLRIIDNSSQPIKLRSNIINKIYQDSRGRVWVLSDMGIDIIGADFLSIKNLHIINPISKDPVKLFFDISEINQSFWVACYSYGILKVDADGKVLKVLTSADGLCNDGVYKIFHGENNNLIVTSNSGLSLLNTADYSFINYYEHDGLHSDAFEEACGIEKNGRIYAGGLNGFTIVDPKLLTNNAAPPRLYLSAIRIDTKNSGLNFKDSRLKDIIIPEDVLQTTVSFVGLNYTNPNRVKFRYKIEELNYKWINLGSRNFINIIGISPGDYNLFIQAANEDGVWTKIPLHLRLEFLPHWYQTWWFKLLIMCVVCAFFMGIYAYRVNQLKVQHQIRRDIANDLHDDLGCSLNSIKIFTHLALDKKENKEYVGEIDRLITHTTLGLRDMLWVLEDAEDDLSELMERIRKNAGQIADGRGIILDCFVDQNIRQHKISKTAKRSLLLIAKEAINNCFKYADCTCITVRFQSVGNRKIKLLIRDNGRGFDVNTQKEGYGLNNIRYRAAQINYVLRVTSSPGSGTSILVKEI